MQHEDMIKLILLYFITKCELHKCACLLINNLMNKKTLLTKLPGKTRINFF